MRSVRLGLLCLALWNVPAHAAPDAVVASTCEAIASASARHHLPIAFLTRLIWQESRFDPRALSPAGAQGVAQFMPDTAAERGLADPFSMPEAIDHSGAYLADLRDMFGNLGLAAAAYNAGPGRLSRWFVGDTDLPRETIDYVAIVTGHTIEEWRADKVPNIDTYNMFSCPNFVAHAGRVAVSLGRPSVPAVPQKAWAVILLGSPRRDAVIAEYQRIKAKFADVLGTFEPSVVHKRIAGLEIARYIVQIEWDRRQDANDLCARLQKAGGSCVVLSTRVR